MRDTNLGDSVYIATATTTVVKASPGVLRRVIITETAAGAITLYDNASAGSGTILAAFKASVAEQSFELNLTFTNGLTIVTAAASKLTVVFQ